MKQILTLLLLIVGAMTLWADNLSEAEYYQKKADGYRLEAEYYQKKAKGYENEAEYWIKPKDISARHRIIPIKAI